MQSVEQANQQAVDLHWLVFLLTRSRAQSVDVPVEAVASQDGLSAYFSTWMVAWSRRLVIARALAAIRCELAASARHTESKRIIDFLPARDWALDQGTTEVEIENTLLAIDVFPRAVLLLSVFEGMPIDDAAVLLDAGPKLVSKALMIGSRELARNFARIRCSTSIAAKPSVAPRETQYA